MTSWHSAVSLPVRRRRRAAPAGSTGPGGRSRANICGRVTANLTGRPVTRGGHGRQDHVGPRHPLGAEAAADVLGDHPHLPGLQPEHRGDLPAPSGTGPGWSRTPSACRPATRPRWRAAPSGGCARPGSGRWRPRGPRRRRTRRRSRPAAVSVSYPGLTSPACTGRGGPRSASRRAPPGRTRSRPARPPRAPPPERLGHDRGHELPAVGDRPALEQGQLRVVCAGQPRRVVRSDDGEHTRQRPGPRWRRSSGSCPRAMTDGTAHAYAAPSTGYSKAYLARPVTLSGPSTRARHEPVTGHARPGQLAQHPDDDVAGQGDLERVVRQRCRRGQFGVGGAAEPLRRGRPPGQHPLGGPGAPRHRRHRADGEPHVP